MELSIEVRKSEKNKTPYICLCREGKVVSVDSLLICKIVGREDYATIKEKRNHGVIEKTHTFIFDGGTLYD